jgi:hypothetical protein
MRKKRPSLSSSLIRLAAAVLPLQAAALEFGSAPHSIALGQPLDFSVPLRLEPGESIAAECATADVTLGYRQIPRPLVRAQVQQTQPGSATVRATTSLLMDEPLVYIEISVGCPARLTRRFVVLADPSVAAAPSATSTTGPAPPPVREAPPPADSAVPPATRPMARVVPVTPAPAPPSSSAPATRPAPPPPPRRESVNRPARAPAPPTSASAPSPSRLRMEPVDEPAVRQAKPLATIVEEAIQAIEAVTQSASSARAAASAASTASARIAALEKMVLDLDRSSRVQREQMLQMQAQQMAADNASRWFTPLLLLLAALAGLAGWLAWRLRQVQLQTRPAVSPASTLPVLAPARHGDGDGVTSMPPNYDSTLPPNSSLHAGSTRDVSISELIDLEQQAEFFIALGQEESAVELLTDHLRNSEGGSPLAYLKLLEIYRRRGDRAAYEHIRQGFNQLFNAYAPVWEADLQAGLSLEDYPDVVQNLQKVWPRPAAALAEIGKLIFHTTHGDVFDLPAYREVLFLYALARDLVDHRTFVLEPINRIAPLPEVAEFSGTEQHHDLADDELPRIDGAEDSETPTRLTDLDLEVPLDFDLSSNADTSATVIEIGTATDINFNLPLKLDLNPDLDLDLDLDLTDLPPEDEPRSDRE